MTMLLFKATVICLCTWVVTRVLLYVSCMVIDSGELTMMQFSSERLMKHPFIMSFAIVNLLSKLVGVLLAVATVVAWVFGA